MTVRVGVNGFGRIGRNAWRADDAKRLAGILTYTEANRLVDIVALVSARLP